MVLCLGRCYTLQTRDIASQTEQSIGHKIWTIGYTVNNIAPIIDSSNEGNIIPPSAIHYDWNDKYWHSGKPHIYYIMHHMQY